VEIYLYTAGNEDPELIEIDSAATVRELLAVGDGQGAELVMIEETAEPVELDISIEQAGIRHRHHVHRGRCRRVDVRVRYNGDKSSEFHPVATIRRVFDWATGPDGFNLTPEQKAEHVLALPGADHFLDWEVRIGSIVTPGTCDVVLDLAPKSRFEG
jgi:hypothetical protein